MIVITMHFLFIFALFSLSLSLSFEALTHTHILLSSLRCTTHTPLLFSPLLFFLLLSSLLTSPLSSLLSSPHSSRSHSRPLFYSPVKDLGIEEDAIIIFTTHTPLLSPLSSTLPFLLFSSLLFSFHHSHSSLLSSLLPSPLLNSPLISSPSLFYSPVKDLGIEEDTIIIFTSDNGPENGAGTSGPYRERKRSLMVRTYLHCMCTRVLTVRTCITRTVIHSLIHSVKYKRSLNISHTPPFFLSFTFLPYRRTYVRTHINIHPLFLSLTHTHILSLHDLSLTHTRTHSQSHSFSHTRTLTLYFLPSLSPTLIFSFPYTKITGGWYTGTVYCPMDRKYYGQHGIRCLGGTHRLRTHIPRHRKYKKISRLEI